MMPTDRIVLSVKKQVPVTSDQLRQVSQIRGQLKVRGDGDSPALMSGAPLVPSLGTRM